MYTPLNSILYPFQLMAGFRLVRKLLICFNPHCGSLLLEICHYDADYVLENSEFFRLQW
jgi:hypothetical protein